MKIRQIILIPLILLLDCMLANAQQEVLFNQYRFNQALFNPAYTGVNDAFHASAVSRRQWIGIEGAPLTNGLNVSSSFWDNQIGVGLLVVNDRFGVNNNTEIQAMYSYQIEMLNSRSLSFGLQTGHVSYQYDFSKLNLEQPDAALDNALGNISQTNFGAGLFFRGKNYYAGFSIPKILNTEVNDGIAPESRYKKHMYLSAGVVFDQLVEIKLKPSILAVIADGEVAILDLNAQVLLMEVLWVGASLRNFNTVGLNGQFEFKSNLRLGYAFEIPFNEVTNPAFTSHELMVSIDMAIFKGQGVSKRYF
ncbi:MAG: type IX secretion system membrane protein PorP/SprF [Cyclobacteriaceae bacterium]